MFDHKTIIEATGIRPGLLNHYVHADIVTGVSDNTPELERVYKRANIGEIIFATIAHNTPNGMPLMKAKAVLDKLTLREKEIIAEGLAVMVSVVYTKTGKTLRAVLGPIVLNDRDWATATCIRIKVSDKIKTAILNEGVETVKGVCDAIGAGAVAEAITQNEPKGDE